MEVCDFPYQRKPQPCTAVFPAAGFVYPEKGLEDTPLKLCRDTTAGVCHINVDIRILPGYTNPDGTVRAVVLDGIFCQVKEQPVD